MSAAEPPRPNVVLILADDLGYGDVGCFGQKQIQTPNLDRLAREGMRFTDFYAGSTVCAPSRCVLMTGYHTGHCSIRGNSKQNLRPEEVTVAEVLKSAGYATALFGKWGLGHEGSSGVPTRQGFDAFFGYLDQHHAHNYYPAFLMKNEERFALQNVVPGDGDFGGGVATTKAQYSHDLIAGEAIRWIESQKDKPFFLYLALTIPHANNEARQKGMEVPDLGPYADKDWPEPQKAHAAMITRMDRDIGRVMARLKELGVDDNTLVFFSSDNGPHAEGGNDPQFNDSNGLLKGIKRDLTDGGIRVPTIARWPGKIAAGGTSDHVGYFADILPTLAELAGVIEKVPTDMDGVSLTPTLVGKPDQQKQHDYLYWAFYERSGGQAVRMGKWKAVQQPISTPLRLYDLSTDIGEERDAAAEHPEVVAKATAAMKEAYRPSEEWKFPAAGAAKGGKAKKAK
ncbi:MAG TPA: arylsulfatase [Pirellulaceae bacterium]|nr:arylsulfatase [Pirellulaceae bacterium]